MKALARFALEMRRIHRGFGTLFAVKYACRSLLCVSTVLKTGSLGCVDARIRGNVGVTAMGHKLELLGDMMPTIREVLLKNCYGFDARRRYAAVVDLGSNRGVFSVIAAKCARKVIAVECNEREFAEKFRSVMRMNGTDNATLVNAVAGSRCGENQINMNRIVEKFELDEVSFLKVDIEGAEDDLFSGQLEWLDRTKQIAMEVHPLFGVDAAKIMDTLTAASFSLRCYDTTMRPVANLDGVGMGYIWASKCET